jgi:hypothetical protein
VTGGWRKMHNEELRDLYFSPGIIKMIKPMRHCPCSTNGEKKTAYRLLMGKQKGKI